jgi:hypothetical protein
MSFAGFEALTAVTMEASNFWDMTSYSLVSSPFHRNVLTSVHLYWTTRRHIPDDLSIINTVFVWVEGKLVNTTHLVKGMH